MRSFSLDRRIAEVAQLLQIVPHVLSLSREAQDRCPIETGYHLHRASEPKLSEICDFAPHILDR